MNEHGVERRRWPRGETRSAAVATPDGSAPIYCVITDINAHGARIEFRREVPPDEFYLIDIGGAVAYQSSIAWRMGCLVGVKFSEQWDLSTEYAPDWLRQLRKNLVRFQSEPLTTMPAAPPRLAAAGV